MSQTASDYRPDVDGLRALAVLSVLFYHFEIPGFTGGYVGVDVFFVISGYLITRLINNDLAANRFSFKNFYLRRVRRIMPAFLATVIASFAVAACLFTPVQLQRFGGEAASSLLAASNFYFWHEAGYFDEAAKLKPLLHTWSLAIEEQFYFIWPAFLLLLFRYLARPAAMTFLMAAGLFSLLLSAYCLKYDTMAAFYLLPFRAFEFALGAALVWMPRPSRKGLDEVSFIVGILTILAAVFFFVPQTPFPGFNALLPCLGAALAIYGGQAPISGALLRNPLAVGIGLISYSLYLIHWPLFVFASYVANDALNAPQTVWLIIAALVGAVLMYRYIETPFRRGAVTPKKLVLGCVAVITLFSAFGLHAYASKGWLWRYPPDQRLVLAIDVKEMNNYVWKQLTKRATSFDETKSKKVLLIGDSQAGDLLNTIVENGYDKGIDLKTIMMPQECQPVIPANDDYAHLSQEPARDKCRAMLATYRDSPMLDRADVIILASAWYGFGLDHIDNTVKLLRKNKKAKVIVMGSKILSSSSIALVNAHRGVPLVEMPGLQPFPEAAAMNKQLKTKKGITFINTYDAFCEGGKICKAFTDDGQIIFYDNGHATPTGAKYLGQLYKKNGVFKAITP